MKTTEHLVRIALLGAFALTAGCASQKTWVYHPNSYPKGTTSTGKKVVVPPFEDARENENHNLWGMYMIPAFPCGWQTYNTPEGVPMHITSAMWMNYKPTEDYAKALAEDLRKTGLFAEASFDYSKGNGDYIVSAKILNTRYKGYVISYGLSVYGPMLWLFGFPAGTVSNELTVELSLADPKTNKSLFSKTYTAAPYKKVSWIYVTANDFNYAEMLAEINKQFCTDIQPVIQADAVAAATP